MVSKFRPVPCPMSVVTCPAGYSVIDWQSKSVHNTNIMDSMKIVGHEKFERYGSVGAEGNSGTWRGNTACLKVKVIFYPILSDFRKDGAVWKLHRLGPFVLVWRVMLNFWRRNYFFNFSTLCIWNVNNTGTKYVRIMKQTAFWRGKNGEYTPCLKYSVPIFVV